MLVCAVRAQHGRHNGFMSQALSDEQEDEQQDKPKDKQVLGACPHDCPDTCSLLTTVRDGVALRVQGNPLHPHTDGVLCTKVSRYTERTYHPERLLQPLRRVGAKGPGARFEPVSWADALADIAKRLADIAATDPEGILPYSYAGTMGQVQGESMAARFFHRLGAARLDRTICASAGAEALVHTLGAKLGTKMEWFAESKLIVIWGSNAIGSNLHFGVSHNKPSAKARVWFVSTRGALKPPINVMNTWPCVQAPTRPWPWASCMS